MFTVWENVPLPGMRKRDVLRDLGRAGKKGQPKREQILQGNQNKTVTLPIQPAEPYDRKSVRTRAFQLNWSLLRHPRPANKCVDT